MTEDIIAVKDKLVERYRAQNSVLQQENQDLRYLLRSGGIKDAYERGFSDGVKWSEEERRNGK